MPNSKEMTYRAHAWTILGLLCLAGCAVVAENAKLYVEGVRAAANKEGYQRARQEIEEGISDGTLMRCLLDGGEQGGGRASE